MRKALTALLALLGALSLSIGLAGSAAAASGTTTNQVGSGFNHVSNVQLRWHTSGTTWDMDDDAIVDTNVRVWNPTGNQHGLIYAAVHFPAGASGIFCSGGDPAPTDGYHYLGAVTDGNTKVAPCSFQQAPSSSNMKVQLISVGEGGGELGRWCVSIRPSVTSTAGGNC